MKLLVLNPEPNILYIISSNQDSNPMTRGLLLLFLYYYWGKSGLEKLNKLPQVTAWIQTKVGKAFTHNLFITGPMW